jgi:glutathione S-transferase
VAELILYSNKRSRGIIAHWMLEELSLPYQVKWITFGPRMKSRVFTEINPMGKVPVLQHGEAIVTETPAILTYLADTFSDKDLIPPHASKERAAFYRWMHFIAGPLETATSAKFLGWSSPQTTPLGTPTIGFLGFGSLALTLSTLENHLKENLYVCGNQFTAVDIYLASHLNFSMMVSNTIEQRPILIEYLNRLNQRPAKLRANDANA